jgi:hypothetical protein
MSETKFTKGQWQYDGKALHAWYVSCANDDVCTVESSEHDAHLIAAAPDMYAMLDRLSSQLTDINAHSAANEIEALLAKARGDK